VLLTVLALMVALLAAAIGGPITSAATASFAAKQDFGTGTSPRSVTVGDLNGDGKLDLAVTNLNSNTVSVLLNTTAPGAATPSFAAKQDFATGAGPVSVSVGDLNGDGKLDLAVVNFNSNTVSVLLNTTAPGAMPSFAAKQDFVAGDGPILATLGDLNGDGKLDLAVANLLSNTVSVLLNTTAPGAATLSFAANQDFATGTSPVFVTVGDLNEDGQLDLAVANLNSNTVSVLLNTTTIVTATPTPTPTPTPTSTTGATFVNLDTTTQGSWKGVYGSDGFEVVNDAINYPSYAQVTVTNQSNFIWEPSTSDVRALQKAATADRIAATLFSSLI
jgi:hypothetical protein